METNSQICCTRTFYGAVNWFAENCPKKQWLITCEDDISIVKKGFIKKLLDVIELSKSIEGEFDYISLGYLPIEGFVNYNGEQLYGNFKVCENVAMAKSKTGGWIINFYNGNKKINTFT